MITITVKNERTNEIHVLSGASVASIYRDNNLNRFYWQVIGWKTYAGSWGM